MQRLYEKRTPMELAKRADLIGTMLPVTTVGDARSCARVTTYPQHYVNRRNRFEIGLLGETSVDSALQDAIPKTSFLTVAYPNLT